MKVLHIAESFASGTMEIVLTLSQRLSDEGHEVAIAYGRRPETPADVRAMVDERIEVYATPWTDRRPLTHLRSIRYLRELVTEWQPDVVHLHSSFAGLAGVLAVGRKAPVVYTPHGYSFAQRGASGPKRSVFVALERFVASRVTLLGAVSDDEARLAREVARAKRVVAVPNGIRELDDPAGADGIARERPRVVAMGRIAPQHQPAGTARILASVADLADVVWIGDGEDPAEVAPVRAAGVEITGWVTRAKVLELLGSADVYLHWSAWDGHPLTVLEALARDVVVVASDIGPTREILGSGQVFATEETAGEAIRAVLTDPAQRQAFLVTQHERRGLFAAKRMSSRWLELYAELAAS